MAGRMSSLSCSRAKLSRAILSAGALPQRKAIGIAQQISLGMTVAHRKGIVHRDLKPENLFVTREGIVKILDFGLAKLNEGKHTYEQGTQTTAGGEVMGTIGYMSPEQARGLTIDSRSDIFSFGAVLYQMLSGRKPFDADSPADTLSAILNRSPTDLSQIVAALPPALDRTVQRCLEKNRDDRFQSASDLGFALDTLAGFSVQVPLASTREPSPRASPRRMMMRAAASAVIVAVLLGGVYAAASRFRREAPTFHQLTFRRGTLQAARFAADGQTIVYAAAWEGQPAELYSTLAQAGMPGLCRSTSTGLFALSSKGEMAVALEPRGFGRVLGTLARAALAGGVPRQIAERVLSADWSPDGAELAFVRNDRGNHVLEYPLGHTLYDPEPGHITHIRFSPSGDAIAALVHPVDGDTAGSVVLVDLKGQAKTLSIGWNSVLGLAWSPDGKEVWFTGARSGASQAIYAVTRTARKGFCSQCRRH